MEPQNGPLGLVESYFAALNRKDLDAILEMFGEDGTVVFPGAQTARGRTEIERFYAPHFERFGYGRVPHIDEVEERSGLAVVRSHTTGTITVLADASSVEAVSRELFVLRRDDGGWRFWQYMANQPAPLPG